MTDTLEMTADRLGLASIDAQSRNIDWREALGEDCEIITPTITFGLLAERAADLLDEEQTLFAKTNPDEPAGEDLTEAFRDSDAFYEWRDGFEPMMSYLWPAFLPYGMEAQTLADRLEQFAPTITLIYFGEHSDHCPEEYAFALSGGGMNLADQIAAAYLCADQVPPQTLLSDLAGVIGECKLEQVGAALRLAYAKAADFMRTRAERLEREAARIFEEKAPA